MPRKPKDVELANLPDAAVLSVVAPTVTEERRERELEEILTELGSDTSIRVYRRGTDGAGKNAMCGQMSGDGFTLDALLDAYGGGDYTLQIFQGRTLKDRVMVSLDPSVPPKNPRVKPLPPGQAPTSSVGDMTALIAAMAQMSMSQQQMMANMMAMQQQSTTGLIGAVTAMMGARPKDADPVETAVRIAEVMKGNGGAAPSAMDMFTIFEKGMNVASKVNGDDDGVLPMIQTGVSTLGGMVNAIIEERKAKTQLALAQAQRSEVVPGASRIVGVPVASGGDGLSVVGAGKGDDISVGGFGGESRHVAGSDDSATAHSRGGINGNGGASEAVSMTHATAGDRPWVAVARPNIGVLLSAAKFMPPHAAAATLDANLTDEQYEDLINDVFDETPPGFGVRLARYFPQAASVDPNWLGAVLSELLAEDDDGAASGDEGTAEPETDQASPGEATPRADGGVAG